MGEVYRVEDKKVGQDIALKFIRPEIAATGSVIERFRLELKTARMIAHRNVCRMFDLGEDQGTYFITMEYVSGEDLKSFIRRSTQLAAGTAIRIARQVAEGLAEAHRLGVIHRDLKPQNIMIDKEGNAKIMDFGIARTAETATVTREGAIIGTPEYMPPEQAEGRAVDQRSDLYSLGAVLFEMLTGKLPFEGRTALDLAIKHKTAAPPDPKTINPHIPAEVSRLVLKCLEKEAPARYQTALELISDLDRIESANPARPRSAIPAMSRKAKAVFGILGVAILIAVLLPVIKPRGRAESCRSREWRPTCSRSSRSRTSPTRTTGKGRPG
jgi:serine/threonine protein kinase